MTTFDGADVSKLSGWIQTSPTTSEADEAAGSYANKYPALFKLVAQLTFTMWSHIIKSPTRKLSCFAKFTLNPYSWPLSQDTPHPWLAPWPRVPFLSLWDFYLSLPSLRISTGLSSFSCHPSDLHQSLVKQHRQ